MSARFSHHYKGHKGPIDCTMLPISILHDQVVYVPSIACHCHTTRACEGLLCPSLSRIAPLSDAAILQAPGRALVASIAGSHAGSGGEDGGEDGKGGGGSDDRRSSCSLPEQLGVGATSGSHYPGPVPAVHPQVASVFAHTVSGTYYWELCHDGGVTKGNLFLLCYVTPDFVYIQQSLLTHQRDRSIQAVTTA